MKGYGLVLVLTLALGATGVRAAEREPATTVQAAVFKEGQGVILSAATAAAIGLVVVDVEETTLVADTRLAGQVYRAADEASQNLGERAGCAYASAMVTPEAAQNWEPEAPFRVSLGGETATGRVVMVDHSMIEAGGQQVDVLLEIPDPDNALRIGSFVEASLAGGAGVPATVVPRSAVLHTAQGPFVFVRNGDAFLRTPVVLGTPGAQSIEVADGLFEGDSIAASAVETLYLIELRATKGGGHSH